jgi:3-mercaptopyruvate sulfurtransferase SseA
MMSMALEDAQTLITMATYTGHAPGASPIPMTSAIATSKPSLPTSSMKMSSQLKKTTNDHETGLESNDRPFLLVQTFGSIGQCINPL